MNDLESNVQSTENKADNISLKDIYFLFMANLKWFVLSVFVCLLVAVIIAKSSVNYYSRTATVIINDEKNRGSSAENLVMTQDLLGLGGSSIHNELCIMKSNTIMREVVERLNLGTVYTYKPILREVDMYERTPVHVVFPDDSLNSVKSFKVVPQNSKKVLLEGFDNKERILVNLWDTTETPVGRVVIMPTWAYNDNIGVEVTVSKHNVKQVADAYASKIVVEQVDPKNVNSSVVKISLEDPSAYKAEVIINTLIDIYNEESIKDKARVMNNSLDFINTRIAMLNEDLASIESNLATFKRTHRLVDLKSYGEEYLRYSDEYIEKKKDIENQIAMVQYVKEYVEKMGSNYQLIPMNVGIEDAQIETIISEYNTAFLQKERYKDLISSDKNPIIREIEISLSSDRKSVV